MNIQEIEAAFESVIQTLLTYLGSLGIVGAIAMPFIESVIPMIPLNVIILGNVGNYGLMGGFLLSYVGSVVGTITVFLFIRYFITDWFLNLKFIKNNEQLPKIFNWIEAKGIWVLMILMIIPIFPHSLINYACALSTMKKREFYAAMMAAKAFSIGFYAFLGDSLFHIFDNPKPFMFALFVLVCIMVISHFIQQKFMKEDEADDSQSLDS